MSARARFHKFGPFFNGGALVTAPHIFHYAAGTGTLKDAYADRDKLATVAQPLVGDANGIATAFFDPDAPYKIVVKTSDENTTLYTWDNFDFGIEPPTSGTWTPSLGGTATYSSRQGYYYKVGRLVQVSFSVIPNTMGTGSTYLISGLPYAATNQTNYRAIGHCYYASAASSITQLIANVAAAGTNIVLCSTTAAAATQTISAIFQSGTVVQGSVTYETDS